MRRDLCEVGQVHDGTDLGVFNAPTELDPNDEYLPREQACELADRRAKKRGCRWVKFDCTYSEYIDAVVDPMTDPAFLDAVANATLPGLHCHIDRGRAGTFILLSPHRDPFRFDGSFYATPCWEGAKGIAVSIEREGSVYTDTIPCEFSGDGVEDAHRYLAAMRRWQRTLPTLYARWDCDPDTDFTGSVLDLCAQFDGTNLWARPGPQSSSAASLLDILGEKQQVMAAYIDNMVIRTTPHNDEEY